MNTDASGNALAAANTYINNFRQGSAAVTLTGPNNIPYLPGTPVTARMGSNAFNFGTYVPGLSQSDINTYLGSNPTAGSTADNFQQFINTYFNAVVPSNEGKWAQDEGTQNSLTMGPVDTVTAYAKTHQMMARMHNLIWGSQQPGFVNTDLTNAQSSNPTTAAAGKAALNTAITNRVGYYVGGGDSAASNFPNNQNNSITGDVRAKDYSQIDVLNEAMLTAPYWSVLGSASGVANVYTQVANAVKNAGANARLYTNEYNVLQFSSVPGTSTGDPYANWYKGEVETINSSANSQGFVGQAVNGVGVQYYPTVQTPSPAAVTAALANLAVEGLPISITEFGEQSGLPAADATTVLDQAMHLFFGNPNINTFMFWGWWAGATDSLGSTGVLVNTDWKTGTGAWDLTTAGQTFVNDMTAFTTPTQTINVGANGQISFNGFYGSYYLSGQQPGAQDQQVIPFDFSLNKGTTSYNTTVNKPTNWFFWKTNSSNAWNTAGNWTNALQDNTVPNTAGFTAYFGTSATSYNMTSGAATTVTINKPIFVTLASPITLGMLVFDSPNTYTLAGSTISLQGYNNATGHAAAIYVNNGSHTISSSLTLLDNTTVTVGPAASTLTTSGIQSASASLTQTGAGNLILGGTNSIAGGVTVSGGQLSLPGGSLAAPNITVNAGGTLNYTGGTLSPTNLSITGGQVNVVAASNGVLVLNALSVSGTAGKLDLTNNNLIVHNGNPTDIFNQLALGSAGNWQGTKGVTSSSAAAAGNTALGMELNNDGNGNTLVDTFEGQTVSNTDVLVKYTFAGDANLDGTVNGSDYTLIDNGFNSGMSGWRNGDFNYDGSINGDDYMLIDNAFNTEGNTIFSAVPAAPTEMIASDTDQVAGELTSVPEPGSVVLLSFSVAGLLGKRRRRS